MESSEGNYFYYGNELVISGAGKPVPGGIILQCVRGLATLGTHRSGRLPEVEVMQRICAINYTLMIQL